MSELSFLTIVVSLAVCSLLIYAVFQYMKVRLNVLEQSQKEQALILQQFIEESSTDISRLYKISANNGRHYEPQGSIILEYANDIINENNEHEQPSQKQPAYNEPHMIHLDTAIFQNKKSNLIEISSDSENTTESESDDSSSTSSTCSNTIDERESDSSSTCSNSIDEDSGSESDNDSADDSDKFHPDQVIETSNEQVSHIVTEVEDIVCETVEHNSDIKLVTVDLGTIHESVPSKSSSPENTTVADVLTMLCKKSQNQTAPIEESSGEAPVPTTDPALEPVQAPAPAPAPANVSYTSMSVTELRHLLKEKYKQHPEKYGEIQKLKKAELVYALQNANV